MKKLLFLILALTACSTLPRVSSYSYDLTQYKDIMMTTGDVFTKYVPISLIEITIRSGVVNIKEDNKGAKKGDPVYYRGGSFKDATAEEAIEEAYKKCKSLGANGLINIKITPYISKQYCILVTGLAVKM